MTCDNCGKIRGGGYDLTGDWLEQDWHACSADCLLELVEELRAGEASR